MKTAHDSAKRRHQLSPDSFDRTVVTITLIGGDNEHGHPGRWEDDAMARAARLLAMSPTAAEAEKAEKVAIDAYNSRCLRFSDDAKEAKGVAGGSGAFAAALKSEEEGENPQGADIAAINAAAEKKAAEGSPVGKGAHKFHHSHHLFHHHEGGINRRTPLLDGSVTCAVLRVSMSDRSKRHFPPTWEGYWSALISPVYFGKQSKRILTKRDKANRPPKPPKPPPRRHDPESVLAEREFHFQKLHKRGMVMGLDGHEHPTPDQLHAEFERDRALMKLKNFDAREKRKAMKKQENQEPPWYHREKPGGSHNQGRENLATDD